MALPLDSTRLASWKHLNTSRGYSRRRQWHPTPVLLPGKSHGQRSLEDCSPKGFKEPDMTEWFCTPTRAVWCQRLCDWLLPRETCPGVWSSTRKALLTTCTILIVPFSSASLSATLCPGFQPRLAQGRKVNSSENHLFGSTLRCCYETLYPSYLWPNLSIHK